MTTCKFEKSLVDLIQGQLSLDQQSLAKNHVDSCEACRKKYLELKAIHSMLMKRQRPEPSKKLLACFRQYLKHEFIPRPKLPPIKERLFSAYRLFFDSDTMGLRTVKIVSLILVGIFIGRMIFYTRHERSMIKPNIMLISFTPADRQFMTDFFIESEIWLLALVNISPHEEYGKPDLLFHKEIARKLLMKTPFMDEIKLQLNNEMFTKVYNRLELLLLEVANTSDEKLMNVSLETGQIIKNTTLLIEMKVLREIIAGKDVKS